MKTLKYFVLGIFSILQLNVSAQNADGIPGKIGEKSF